MSTAALAVRDLVRLQGDAPSSRIVDALHGPGAVILDNVLDSTKLDTLKHELEPWFARAFTSSGMFYGSRTRRFSALFAKSDATRALAIQPNILSAVETFLRGPQETPVCDSIQLHLTQAIAIEPGEKAQVIHRDDKMFPFRFPFEIMVNVMWAIDPFTAENGATRIVGGSHDWHIDRRPDDTDIQIAEAPAGSAICWTGATLHGGGANLSNCERRGIVFSYSLGWLAQAEKLLLAISPEIARTLPERLQELIGYQVHRPNLGWVEGRDPREWLKGETGDLAQAQDLLTPEAQERMERFLRAERESAP